MQQSSASSTTDEPLVITTSQPLSWLTASIVGRGNEFVCITSAEVTASTTATAVQPVAVSRSSNGLEWEPVSSDLPLTRVHLLASDDDRLVAVGWGQPDLAALQAWTSADGGATWTGGTLTAPATALSPYTVVNVRPLAAAISEGSVIVLGTVLRTVDWGAFSRAETGQDHGGIRDERYEMGQLLVTFDDGYVLTVDLAAVGLSDAPSGWGTNTIWRSEGTDWVAEPTPFDPTPVLLAAGPAGLIGMSTSPAASNEGSLAFRTYLSADGRTWSPGAAIDTTGGPLASFVGGPIGYLVATNDAILRSSDGQLWTEVHRFTDLNPQTFVNPLSAAGRAGAVIAIQDMGNPMLILWSSDLATWNETALPLPAMTAIVAANDRAMLVIPIAS